MNKPLITPITETQIDWGLFIDSVIQLTGQSPTRQLDQDHIRPGPPYTFLKALEFFSQQPGDYLQHHLSFGFLIGPLIQQHYFQILKRSKLNLVEAYRLDTQIVIMITGTLYEWREACLEFCVEDVDFILRYIFDYIYLYFHNSKLLTLHKLMLKDQTFTLALL